MYSLTYILARTHAYSHKAGIHTQCVTHTYVCMSITYLSCVSVSYCIHTHSRHIHTHAHTQQAYIHSYTHTKCIHTLIHTHRRHRHTHTVCDTHICVYGYHVAPLLVCVIVYTHTAGIHTLIHTHRRYTHTHTHTQEVVTHSYTQRRAHTHTHTT